MCPAAVISGFSLLLNWGLFLLQLLLLSKSLCPMLENMLRDVRLGSLQQTHSADCSAGVWSLEKEPPMDLTDVLDDLLLPRLHPAVLADLAAPPQEVGGQNDGGGIAAFIRHPVDLCQVLFDLIEGQKVRDDVRELK